MAGGSQQRVGAARADEAGVGHGTPLIHTYACHRRYLADFVAWKQSYRKGFSFRRIASLAGLSSPNFLQMVIAGKRNMSVALAERVAAACGLTTAERRYFVGLVARSHAKTPDELESAGKQLQESASKLLSRPLNNSHLELLSNWYTLLIRELVFLPDFQPDGSYIARKLGGLIDEGEALRAFGLLLSWGFVRVRAGGGYEVCDPVIDTGDHALRRAVLDEHHSQTLLLWGRVLTTVNSAEQERGLLNIALAADRLPELREKLRRFQDELIGWAQEETAPERVVQVGIYCIPFN